jgi:hypothetical protein
MFRLRWCDRCSRAMRTTKADSQLLTAMYLHAPYPYNAQWHMRRGNMGQSCISTSGDCVREWIQHRWRIFAFTGLVVCASAFTLEPVRREWAFSVLCFLVGFPAAIAALWGKERLLVLWGKLRRQWRVLIACIAAVGLWALTFVAVHHQPDRVFTASVVTGIALVLWAVYCTISRVLDAIWARVRR